MSHAAPTVKNLFFKMLIYGIALSLLHILLERAMAFVGSDVTMADALPYLNLAIVLCDAAFFFVLYALVFSATRFGIRQSLSVLLLPVALSLFKHIANWIAFLITENITKAIDIRLSFTTATSSIAIELLQYGLVLAVLWLLRKHPDGIRLLGISGAMLAINLFSRLLGDISYGAPSSLSEIGIILAYYSFDIFLYCPLAYQIMRWIVKRQIQTEPTE